MWRGIDKRKFPRANYRCSVTIKKAGLPIAVDTITENIGVGGIAVVLDKPLEIFENVDVELTLDDKRPTIKCKGSAVWIVKQSTFEKHAAPKYDTGIEFIDIKDEDIARIDAVVNDLFLKNIDKPEKPE